MPPRPGGQITPRVVILGGINGAGKTTASRAVLQDVFRRRYARSVRNFIELYRPVADYWTLYDNTDGDRHLLAMGEDGEEAINDEDEWAAFLRSADDA